MQRETYIACLSEHQDGEDKRRGAVIARAEDVETSNAD